MFKDYRIKTLGRILIDKGLITQEQLSDALDNQKMTGRPLGRVLCELGYINEDELLMTLGIQAGMEMVDLEAINIPEHIYEKIPATVAKFYNIVPLSFENNVLTVATAEPLDIDMFDDLKFMLNCNVKGKVAKPEAITNAIKKYYGWETESVQELYDELEEQIKALDINEESIKDAEAKEKLATQLPVVKLVNLILLQAIKQQSSDIHFEPFEGIFRIRYRVDGVLREIVSPPKNLALAITSRIKVMANLDIAETRLPQDGRIFVSIGERLIDLRVSTFPTIFGESVVIRILDKTQVNLSLDEIGLASDTKEKLYKLISRPHGIILSTGPTGCGKTTTQYSCLKHINKIEYKIITTEDPVEYDLEGIIQVAVRPKIDLTFARCLRHILRQDPDIIMVGEIRDAETAEISVHASLTGHLVLSTLHTNDAVTAITRLIDMGIEPFLIASSLEAVLAQRLVRTICENCREIYHPDIAMLEKLGVREEDLHDKKFHRGRGCEECFNSGYRGRTGVFELLVIDDKIRELIMRRSPLAEIHNAACNNGMRTLKEDTLLKVYQGITTLDEVMRIIQGYV